LKEGGILVEFRSEKTWVMKKFWTRIVVTRSRRVEEEEDEKEEDCHGSEQDDKINGRTVAGPPVTVLVRQKGR
jgi:hypothetical protein